MAKLITIEQPLERESAVALGFFDGVHLGHRAVLRAAADCAAEKGLLSGAAGGRHLPHSGQQQR